jgi:hypothetical protein
MRDPETWHEEVFGVCPHGFMARVYCATCSLEDKKAEKPKDQDRRIEVLRQQLRDAGIVPRA